MSRLDAIKKEIDERKKHGSALFTVVDTAIAERYGIGEYKIGEGDHFIRIIPPKDITQHFVKKVFVHENIGMEKRAFLCLEQMGKGVCPICEAYKKIKIKNPQSDLLNNLRYHMKYYMIVVDFKNDETIKSGWKWIKFGPKAYGQLMACIENKRTGVVVDVSDPQTGRCIVFTRKGTTVNNTEYLGFSMENDVCPIPNEWLEIPDFDELLKYSEPLEMEEAVSMYSSTGNSRVLNEQKVTEQKPADTQVRTAFSGGFSRPTAESTSGGFSRPTAEVKPVEQEKPIDEPVSLANNATRERLLSFRKANS